MFITIFLRYPFSGPITYPYGTPFSKDEMHDITFLLFKRAQEKSKQESYGYKLRIAEAHISSFNTIQVITPKGNFLAAGFLFLGLFDLF